MADAETTPTIVIVDDEEIVVTSLQTFLDLETPYRTVTFTSPKSALEHIRNHDVDLVVSDYLMPEMDGITFLSQVRSLKPDVPRIILTGYADKENAIKAINQVGLFQYIEKPWDNEDLRVIVRNGLEKMQLLKKLQLKINEITQAHEELQTLNQEIVKAFA
ncbi:MAG: response regulator [Nitrospirales bacterium]